MDCKRFLEEFIKIYREQPSLWQVKSKDYAKKQKSRELRIIVKQDATIKVCTEKKNCYVLYKTIKLHFIFERVFSVETLVSLRSRK
jgi:hypothetical protein